MVPNSRPMSQVASAHPARSSLDLLRPRARREVEIGAEPPEQRVANGSAHERDLFAGAAEAVAELVDHGRDPQQLAYATALGFAQPVL